MYIYTCTYTHVHIHMYIYTCTYTHVHNTCIIGHLSIRLADFLEDSKLANVFYLNKL